MNSHIHKYERVNIGVNRPHFIYKCSLPNCTHYVSERLVAGRLSICWRCGEAFVIRKGKNGVLKKPHCLGCTKRKDESLDRAAEMLAEKFVGSD